MRARVLLALLAGLMLLPAARAEEETPPPTPVPAYAGPVAQQLEKVYKGPDFQQTKDSRELALRPWVKNQSWGDAFSGFWERLKKWLQSGDKKETPHDAPDLGWLIQAFKLLAVLLIAAALFWLLRQGYRILRPLLASRDKRATQPLTEPELLALSLAKPLPADIAAEARQYWAAGNPTLALSLLYRGAVQALDQRYQLQLPASATEGECLRLAQRSGLAVVPTAFAPIVQAWQALAYARHQPQDFEDLARLFDAHFQPGSSTP